MFSPYYAWAGRHDPLDHVAINVALYGPRARWTMTERGRGALARTAERLEIGPSAVEWGGGGLTIEINETAVPHLSRVRGRIRLIPSALTGFEAPIDGQGRHLWRPFAPSARVEAEFAQPGLRWSGQAYFDANFGTRALECDFRYWTWMRAALPLGAAVTYDTERRDGSRAALALRFHADGRVEHAPPPPVAPLPRTLWRVRRHCRADAWSSPSVLRSFEDAPFYSRSAVATRLWGTSATGVHEALDLDRFATRWCKLMLPFRMPRRG